MTPSFDKIDETQNFKKALPVIIGLIAFGFLSRVIPHPPNFTAMGAVAFASGLWLSKGPMRFLIPLMALILSDLVLGLHQTQWFVYFGFTIAVFLGSFSTRVSLPFKIIGLSLGTFVFFFVSNFGVWLMSGFYSKTLAGLVSCYMAGLPFLPQQFVGDVVYFSGISLAFELYLKSVRTQA